MHAAAARMASRVLCLCVAVSVVNMVSVEMDAGNEKPRTGVGAGSLIESGFFCYAPARPAPVGSVISTSTSSDAAAVAGVRVGLAVVWRCSMARDNHATFRVVKQVGQS
ncbi:MULTISPECIES: hypothetical protein [Stenotrophomonas]|uniref:hypothetical protein n=1 Tax=Stenotrophomonas TaxID=40323 RepID=UPI001CF2ABB5|nr:MULTISPECIES: hypothetical protein [Stenotrophomonas]MCA7023185.1 hypothetical protein [Stenotrophomonas acidaminiphila]MCE4076573.1 hypothetical protein [Stenotrophomonas acidaminiphila]WHL18242.1 hypothetical protein QLF99_14405 [Stenotrophomonas acidaminiphila]